MSHNARDILDDDYKHGRISWLAYAMGEQVRVTFLHRPPNERDALFVWLVGKIGRDDAEMVRAILSGQARSLTAYAEARGIRRHDDRAALGARWRKAIEDTGRAFSLKSALAK